MTRDISDQELSKLILDADDLALKEGVPPKSRTIHVIIKVMEHLGHKFLISIENFANPPPLAERIRAMHSALYRPSDLAMGGLHGGIFMFRDVFARVTIPIFFGSPSIDALKSTDLSDRQLEWLLSRENDTHAFIDQFIDIFDVAGGLVGIEHFAEPPKEARDLFTLAAFQLQAAAATLSVAFDFRGAVQSAVLGAELALKGGLAGVGVNEPERRKHSHNLASAAKALRNARPNFDLERVLKSLTIMPPYVDNRYSAEQPDRVQTGNIVMYAQYVAGEAVRQITGYSIRSALNVKHTRVFP